MNIKSTNMKKILDKYTTIHALGMSTSLMLWDMRVNMPKNAIEDRGKMRSIMTGLYQDMMLNKEFLDLINLAEKEELTLFEKAIIRSLKRETKFYLAIPSEVLKEYIKLSTVAYNEWAKARAKSNFSIFKPHLEKIAEFSRKGAELLGYENEPYDAMLDRYEEGILARDYDEMFNDIKKKIVPIFKKLAMDRSHPLEKEPYNEERLKDFITYIVKKFGYDFNRGRLDKTTHPFTSSIGINDVRITTRYEGGKDFKPALLGSIHEFGHAIYAMQIDPSLNWTPLASGSITYSLGIHESQSRFWENMVGRSQEFIETFYDVFVALVPNVANYDTREIYRYFNIVRPNFIRVEADELCYPIHILLRYELERDMMNEKISISEVPQVWNEKMENYIGIVPPDDARGCLQDPHWTRMLGYFPTYAMGTILAAQIKNKIENEIGPLEEFIRAKNFTPVTNWQKENIHKYGSLYMPKDLIKSALGETMNVDYFVNHVDKYVKLWS
ncbi:MAG: carboxypeptidase M32 [Candidatus Thorarchaeota archaeon]